MKLNKLFTSLYYIIDKFKAKSELSTLDVTTFNPIRALKSMIMFTALQIPPLVVIPVSLLHCMAQ